MATALAVVAGIGANVALGAIRNGGGSGRGTSTAATTIELPAQAPQKAQTPANIVAGQWTWVGGSNSRNQYGTYGTKGIAAPENVPGARSGSVSRTDSSGNLLLFGGDGYAADTLGLLNDLWKWDGTSWAWVNGFNTPSASGYYGTQGVPSQWTVPGARSDLVSWIDTSGNFRIFGGFGYPKLNTSSGYLNDLWKWDGTSWTWVSGTDGIHEVGRYGTKGVPYYWNVPGSRMSYASSTDKAGNLWLFGGDGRDGLGGVWLSERSMEMGWH